MTVTTGGRVTSMLVGILLRKQVLQRLVGHLVFKGDDLGVGPELAGDILHQLGVERLVHGDEHAAHQQAGDQVFAANFELFREVLDADAFRHRNGAGDGQRLHAGPALRQNVTVARSPSSGLL